MDHLKMLVFGVIGFLVVLAIFGALTNALDIGISGLGYRE